MTVTVVTLQDVVIVTPSTTGQVLKTSGAVVVEHGIMLTVNEPAPMQPTLEKVLVAQASDVMLFPSVTVEQSADE